MKIFNLAMSFNTNGELITIADKSGRLADYFIWNDGDGKFLKHMKLHAIAQEEFKSSKIATADFLSATIGIPIFSSRAKGILTAELPNDMEFHEILIDCESSTFQFYIAKVLNYLNLVDESLSSFRLLPDGEKILTDAKYKSLANSKFGIARDRIHSQKLVVSEKFVEISARNHLHISFHPIG